NGPGSVSKCVCAERPTSLALGLPGWGILLRILISPETRPRHPLATARINAPTRKSGAKSGFNQPRGVKAVQPAQPGVVVRQMAGQHAQIAVRRDDLVQSCDLAGVDRG